MQQQFWGIDGCLLTSWRIVLIQAAVSGLMRRRKLRSFKAWAWARLRVPAADFKGFWAWASRILGLRQSEADPL